jgi:beta-ribofuranosylaminobenzene 5'-phosphate synthase
MSRTAHQIVITTGCRLHFGLLTHAPASGRNFGGVGLMLDSPGFQIAAQAEGTADAVEGPEFECRRAEEFLARYRARCPAGQQAPPCRLEIRRCIPPHAGLGSGTQLGMAVSQALRLLSPHDRADPTTLATRVGRGTRSALGIYGFERGGLLVDGGKRNCTGIAPLIARLDFPASWRMILVTPGGESGLSGTAELDAFATLPPMPAATTEHLCRLLVMQLLPAVVEADFAVCSETLFEFSQTVGEYFSPVQGGVYANRRMAELVEHLRGKQIRGVGQTSWGPTLFVLAENETSAESLVADLQPAGWDDCRFTIAAPMNTGAAIEVVPV